MNRKKLSNEEKQILELIEAAQAQKILTYKNSSKSNYFTCTLDGTDYSLCLGCDPDQKHPDAERAIRASKFITRLMDKIRQEHSCYFVQSAENRTPDKNILKYNLNRKRTKKFQVITDPEECDLDAKHFFASSYEIEVETVVAIGEQYARLFDLINVDLTQNVATYAYSSSHKKPLDNDDVQLVNTHDVKQHANNILNFVLKGQLPGKEADENVRKENIKKMLEALANSPNSQLSQFLKKAPQNGVGQISLKPCALLIDAVNKKKLVYSVDGFKLPLIWQSDLGDLNANTALYPYIENGNFIGLTNIQQENRNPINDFNSLVPAYKAEKTENGTSITHDQWTFDESYKHIINNYAVLINDGFTEHYYSRSCVEKDDNGNWVLSADYEDCALTKKRYLRDVLSSADYLENGVIKHGWIFTSAPRVKKFECQICKGSTIYYLLENGQEPQYITEHTLLDEKHFCDKCADEVTDGDKKYRKTENAVCGDKTGTVYALTDGNDFVPIDQGGNVFICTCGKTVLYKDGVEDHICDICKQHICSNCAAEGASVDTSFPWILCRQCASISDADYEAAKKAADDSFQRLQKQKVIENYHQNNRHAYEAVKEHIIKNSRKYLRHLSLKDIKTARESIKTDLEDGNIRIKYVKAYVLDKTVNYEVKIKVSYGQTYLFYIINNKPRFGGVCHV